MSEPRNDLTGRRFGRLTVLGYSGERGTRHYWKVRCDCGVEKECSGESMLYDGVSSCGCARKGATAFRDKKPVTGEQRSWLTRHFHNTRNEAIMERFGWSHSFLHSVAREMGLKKTKQFQTKCQRNAAAKARDSHIINGTYPPKGYIIPGSEENRFKAGVTNEQRLGARKNRKRIEKSAESRRQIWKEERARRLFGLPQQTKLRVRNYGRKMHVQAHYLRKRGYTVDYQSFTAWYDTETHRCPVLEKKGRNPDKGHYFDFREKTV